MKLFLDSSVILAACGRREGASNFIFGQSPHSGWTLLTSGYVVREVEKNLRFRFAAEAGEEWKRLKPVIQIVADCAARSRT